MSAQQHGIAINWSTINAPRPCGGICENWSYGEKPKQGEVDDEQMDLAAVALTDIKGEWSFDTTITDGSAAFPDISEGAKIAITGYVTGTHLISEVVERWALGQAKSGSLRGMHFPKVVGGTGANAGTFDALTPTQAAGAPIIRPGNKVVWSTKGMTSALGKVHGLTITQSVKFAMEADENDDTVHVAVSGYRRTISLDVLVLAAAAVPVTNAILSVVGAPAHAANCFQVSSDLKLVKGKGGIITLQGMWAPGLGLD